MTRCMVTHDGKKCDAVLRTRKFQAGISPHCQSPFCRWCIRCYNTMRRRTAGVTEPVIPDDDV